MAVASKKSLQVWYAAVVDIGVGSHLIPDAARWVLFKVRANIFMDLFLEVNADRSVTTHNNIGTHTKLCRNIPAGIINFKPTSIVGDVLILPR